MRSFQPLLCALIPLVLLVACSKPEQPTISLYRAVHGGDIDQIERHLYWGSDINAQDAEGNMPLHVAAERGRLVVVRLLVENGADVNARNRDGQTPIFVALMAGRTQIADLLLQHGASLEPDALLHAVAENGVADRDVIRFLVARGGRIDAPGANGDSPLMQAVRLGHRKVARMLIDQGANVNARDTAGESVLQIALQYGDPDIIELLRRNGAVEAEKP